MIPTAKSPPGTTFAKATRKAMVPGNGYEIGAVEQATTDFPVVWNRRRWRLDRGKKYRAARVALIADAYGVLQGHPHASCRNTQSARPGSLTGDAKASSSISMLDLEKVGEPQ